VYLAENGDQRWDPGPWEQAGWANQVAADDGLIRFATQDDFRREAIIAGALLVLFLLVALWGTGRKAR
jgi:hypothetical protein